MTQPRVFFIGVRARQNRTFAVGKRGSITRFAHRSLLRARAAGSSEAFVLSPAPLKAPISVLFNFKTKVLLFLNESTAPSWTETNQRDDEVREVRDPNNWYRTNHRNPTGAQDFLTTISDGVFYMALGIRL